MDIGQLRHRVAIERLTRVQDPETGRLTESWQAVSHAWCSITGLSGQEIIAAAATQAKTTHRIMLRHRSDLRAADRLNDGSAQYGIVAILPDNKRRYLRVMCEVLE